MKTIEKILVILLSITLSFGIIYIIDVMLAGFNFNVNEWWLSSIDKDFKPFLLLFHLFVYIISVILLYYYFNDTDEKYIFDNSRKKVSPGSDVYKYETFEDYKKSC